MRRGFTRAAALAAAATALAPATASAKEYIVQLEAPPIASYTGGTKSLKATSPQATGQRHVDARSSAAQAYRSYLDGRQDAALSRVPGTAKVLYDYRVACAGFAADLTKAQAAALRTAPQVAHVWAAVKEHTTAVDLSDPNQVDTLLDGNTDHPDSAAYLGLPTGLWASLGGPDKAGDNVIVGVIDTGITPQHPSFADTAAGNYLGSDYGPVPSRWGGTCDAGDDATFQCNRKLIGARYYVQGFGAQHLAPGSFLSPRDDDGHGTHTSSTAAGNFGVDPSIQGNDLGVNLISGIAPRARVAMYKACWVGGDVADGCSNVDTVAAIDQAVSDGVDVINYSIGGTTSNLIDADEYAFLGASDAGVFVANSAGNSGPGEGSVGTPTTVPWLTSVAADNPARTFQATAHIVPSSGPAFDITGASVTPALSTPTPVVDAAASALPGVAVSNAERCFPDSLDPAKVSGKVVLCKRGVNDRIQKSQAVKDAGGVGMILYNPNAAQDQDTDIHWVPTVHVSLADGLKVKQAIAAGTTTATISAGHAAHGTPKVLAAFSSRGPQGAVPDIAKPDVTAPGVNILAGNTPSPAVADLPSGQLFQSISGTSMASPHVAGSGALLEQAHPDWTPAEIKSALMLTANANVKDEDGTTDATPFDAGSGEIDPTAAADPGLVLDEGTNDYIRYVDSQDPGVFGDGQDPIQPSDLNLASISNSAVTGTFQTVRTFTSVAAEPRRWTASIDVPGFQTGVSTGPGFFSTFSIDPGATQALTISAVRTDAPLYQYAVGTLTLTSGQTTLHIPVTLRPIPAKAPTTVALSTDQPSGTHPFDVRTGYAGVLNATAFGLAAPATKVGETIASSPTGSPDPATASPSNKLYDVTVPGGAQLLSGRVSNADGDADPNTDFDLYLYYDANHDGKFTSDELVDQSASAIADEGVTEVEPPAGSYRFVLVGFTTHTPTSSYDWTTWVLDDAKGDDASGGPGIAITNDPFDATVGGTVTPALQWSNVAAKGLYLGLVTYDDGTDQVATSVVELTKTADSGGSGGGGGTPTPTPTPTPTTTPGPTPTPTPRPVPKPKPKPKARLTIKALRISYDRRHDVLVVRLRLSLPAHVSATVTKRSRLAARARARTVAAGTRTIRMKLDRRLARGTYRVTLLAAKGATRLAHSTIALRVR